MSERNVLVCDGWRFQPSLLLQRLRGFRLRRLRGLLKGSMLIRLTHQRRPK